MVVQSMGLDPVTASLLASTAANVINSILGGGEAERAAAMAAAMEAERKKNQRTIIAVGLGATALVAAVLIFRR